MTDLLLADRAAGWRRLKALVLDSVSSPDYAPGLQPWLGRVLRLVRPGAPAGLYQGDSGRLARCAWGTGARRRFHQRADHGGPETGGGSFITWRIPRRFGGRGLVVVVFIAAVIGPSRGYWYMRRVPERAASAAAPLRRDLVLVRDGTQADAAGRRTGRSRRAGVPTMGTELIPRYWRERPTTACRSCLRDVVLIRKLCAVILSGGNFSWETKLANATLAI
jgi:hypothetical protein